VAGGTTAAAGLLVLLSMSLVLLSLLLVLLSLLQAPVQSSNFGSLQKCPRAPQDTQWIQK
jgi:hypothetical protein